MRTQCEKIGERQTWTSYLTTFHEQNRNLLALREKVTNAGL
jgi:hypothetical protein